METNASITVNYSLGNNNENIIIETNYFDKYLEEKNRREAAEKKIIRLAVIVKMFQASQNKQSKRWIR